MAEKNNLKQGEFFCPVCGKGIFDGYNSLEECECCGWRNDGRQTDDPNFARPSSNVHTLNESRELYNKGMSILK